MTYTETYLHKERIDTSSESDFHDEGTFEAF